MRYVFQPRSSKAILRVQGIVLRAGDEVELERAPRKGHIRFGLRPLDGEPAPTPAAPIPEAEAKGSVGAWSELHWRRRCKLAKLLGKDFGRDHSAADAYLETLSRSAVKALVEQQGW
jgi:hypothetical protein